MQITDLLANIKSTFVSFFSIFMFAALGVGMFLGISWAGPALENAAFGMHNEGSFHNFQIQFPYGLTKDDIAQLAETEGVTQVEPERQSFQTMRKDGRKYTVKVQSLGQDIDVPIIVEGELPTRSGEIAFHAESAKQLGVNIGDTITFEKDAGASNDVLGSEETENTSGMKYLVRDSFTVTAIVNNADYVAKSSATYGFSSSPSGAVDALAWVNGSVFDASAFQNGYPIVNVRCDSLAGMNSFSDGYIQASKAIQEPIEALGTTLATARYDDLHSQVQKKIDEGQAKLDEAEAKIAQGEKEIADGEQQLIAGREELQQKQAEGEAKLADAYQKLVSGEAEYQSGLADYDMYRSAYNAIDSKLAEAKNEASEMLVEYNQTESDYASGKITEQEYNKRLDALVTKSNNALEPAREYIEGLPTVNRSNLGSVLSYASSTLNDYRNISVTIDGRAMTLNEAQVELDAAKAKLDAAQSELSSGWNKYYDGQATLEYEVAQGQQKLADGEAKIEEAKRQVEDGKQQVAANKPKLEEAKAQLADMAKYNWTVMPRAYNTGSHEVSTFSGVTNNLSISMAALFIIVGLLVSYFAVSRIVHEQVTQIDTKKALGFRQREITNGFLWYSGIAVLAGAIVGSIVGFVVVEGIIGGVLSGMFAFGKYPAYFGWGLFLAITAVELLLVLGATYLACRKILKEHAVDLLRGEKPPEGKTRFYEKWGIWDNLPLLIQTIVNNCVNDKRRVLSTIVGVAGCTALIVTALTLNNDVMKSYDRHYENVYGFNAIVYAENEPEGAIANLEAAIQDSGCTTAQVSMKSYLLMQPNGESGAVRIVVPVDEDAFAQLYHVHPISGSEFDPSGEGAWISQAYAEHFGAKVGDIVTIDGGDGMHHEVPIVGISEFWLTYNEIVMGKGFFEKEFGSVKPNVVLSQTGDIAVADVQKAISSIEGFDSIVDDATYQYGNFATFSSVSSAVVLIYIVLALLMAIVVLLNLNVMFIAEKKRELIVLMINGFSVKDARHYISYDSIVLTALGIIAGIILGCIMGSVTVMSIEPITAVFVKAPDAMAILIGIVGSALLAIVMALIALRRINNFELTDINRF